MTCPNCGSSMTIDPRCGVTTEVAEPYHLRHAPVTVKIVPARVALCNGCEHVEKLHA